MNRAYASVMSNVTAADFTALLMGEVSGNWNNTGARPMGSRIWQSVVADSSDDKGLSDKSIAITVPRLETQTNNEVVIPIAIHGTANKSIISYEFDLRYDSSVIRPQLNPVDIAGTVSRGLTVVANLTEPGLLKVVVYGATSIDVPIDGNWVLLNLRFMAVGAPGTVSPLTWERIMFNEGVPSAMATNGQVEISTAIANREMSVDKY